MGEVGDWFVDAGNSFVRSISGGIIDAKKGRFYVPGSSGQMRNWAKGYANAATAGTMRSNIDRAFNTKTAKLAGAAAGVVAGAAAGGGLGSAAGIGAGTGAAIGGATAASVAQADALNQQMPELKVEKPVDSATTAVQQAVAEATSRRSRSRSQRSTILSQNFLSADNPALKATYGS